mgnify:CR=1 FL=1
MGVFFSQKLKIMRRKVRNDQPSAFFQNARRFCNRGARLRQIVQYLVQTGDIGIAVFKRQGKKVAMPHLRMGDVDLEGGAAKKRGKKEVGETSLTQCVPSKKRGAAAAKVEAKQKPPAKKAKGDGNANAKKKEKKEQDEFGKSLAPKTLFHAGNGTPGEML